MANEFSIPELSLVVLIGASGSGKSTFARKHFPPTEVLSSDQFRALVSDDENDQTATDDAFAALHFLAAKRLARGRLTVIDATNVQAQARKPLVELAREHDVLPVAIVLNLPEKLCRERNAGRPERQFGGHVLRQHCQQLRRSLKTLKREGFRHVIELDSPEKIEAVSIVRQRLWNDLRDEHGPFDIIGDIHGCADELKTLLGLLGYQPQPAGHGEQAQSCYRHPENRRVLFLGDLVDRGPDTPEALRIAMEMTAAGQAWCVPGNHDVKLQRKLSGRDVQITHGLAESLAQLEHEPPEFAGRVVEFLDGLVSHYLLDGGRLVVAHAGMKEKYQGRASRRVREFAVWGDTTGETDEYGLPVRYPWAEEYRGKALVVYGHTPVPEPEFLNNTINIDTGCVFGGNLTALRYPEKELVSVPAARVYYTPAKPFLSESAAPAITLQHQIDDVLDWQDFAGKRRVTTALHGTVTIQEEQSAAALEVLSRFAADPKWLIYLPPTMSPSETSRLPGYLEHPIEAFAYFRSSGVPKVVCEEKHMGSRAVIVVCRDQDSARKRFGVLSGETGACFSRTGRHFFPNAAEQGEVLAHVREALTKAAWWEQFETDWFCLDCEIMPWSVKARELLLSQYAATGAAAAGALSDAVGALEAAAARGIEVDGIAESYRQRLDLAKRYTEAYRGYCWPVESIRDIRIAPFHLLASEGKVYDTSEHLWQLETLAKLAAASGGMLIPTSHRVIELTNQAQESVAIKWWESNTASGAEGIVIKPQSFVARGPKGLVQPGVKCRGKEYLRIIYGPEYSLPENLDRLRNRGLGLKRSLALREFALGIEALHRFVRREPLRRVHECVAAVLALESEPVDPRL